MTQEKNSDRKVTWMAKPIKVALTFILNVITVLGMVIAAIGAFITICCQTVKDYINER